MPPTPTETMNQEVKEMINFPVTLNEDQEVGICSRRENAAFPGSENGAGN
jgi:hypothetical protein